MSKLCGDGACGRIALLLLISGLVVAVVFDGLVAIGGAGMVIAAGVFFALALEDRLAPPPGAASDQGKAKRAEPIA
jgi:hypothetical protein